MTTVSSALIATEETKAALIRDALDWVNMMREEALLEPLAELPPGERRSVGGCPIAVALRGCHGDALPIVSSEIKIAGCTQLAPQSIRRFIWAFDGGYLPELDARKVGA